MLPFCPYCGSELQDDRVYCRNCGEKMGLETEHPLEGRARKVILADKQGINFQNIVKRVLRLETVTIQARKRTDNLQAEVKNLETERTRLLAEIEAFKKSSARIQQLGEEVMELAAKKVELEEKVKALETERDGLKNEIQELEDKLAIAELEARAAELETEIRELGIKKKQLEEKISLPEAPPAEQPQTPP